MAVKAKFMCVSVGTQRYTKGGRGTNLVKLNAVYGDSEENKKFFEATPSGSIELNTVKDEAAAQFEPGEEYFVTFEKAE